MTCIIHFLFTLRRPIRTVREGFPVSFEAFSGGQSFRSLALTFRSVEGLPPGAGTAPVVGTATVQLLMACGRRYAQRRGRSCTRAEAGGRRRCWSGGHTPTRWSRPGATARAQCSAARLWSTHGGGQRRRPRPDALLLAEAAVGNYAVCLQLGSIIVIM